MQIPSINGLFQSKLGASGLGAASGTAAGDFASQYSAAVNAAQANCATDFFEMNIVPGPNDARAQLPATVSAWTSAANTSPRASSADSALPLAGSDTADTDGTANTVGGQMVEYAEQFLGTPYVWGGEDLVKGTDCSGFTQSIYKHFGISLPRTSYRQSKVGETVDATNMENLQPGDLLFFKTSDYAPVTHVAMYIGDGKVIHAAGKQYGVIITKINKSMKQELVTVKRVLPQ